MGVEQIQGVPEKYHICLANAFFVFPRISFKRTSRASQFHGNLLALPVDHVTCSYHSGWHVFEVPAFLVTYRSALHLASSATRAYAEGGIVRTAVRIARFSVARSSSTSWYTNFSDTPTGKSQAG